MSSPVLTSVPYGELLQVRSQEGEWLRVRVRDARLGVPDARLDGWIRRCAASAETPCPPPKSTIAMALDVPGKTHWVTPVAVRAVPVVDPLSTINAAAASPSVVAALSGDTKLPEDRSAIVTWVWTVPKDALSAALTLTTRQPTFTAIYHDVAGLPDTAFAPAIVRVVGSPSGAVVALAPGRADAGTREIADWVLARDLKHDLVKTTPLGGNTGMIKTRPGAPLGPGVYGLVLRPMFLTGYAGARVFSDAGIGLAFGEVWLFRVK